MEEELVRERLYKKYIEPTKKTAFWNIFSFSPQPGMKKGIFMRPNVQRQGTFFPMTVPITIWNCLWEKKKSCTPV